MMSVVFVETARLRLCVPQESDCETWSMWFNDPQITKNLDQGMWPNTIQMQKEFLNQSRNTGRILLMVRAKHSDDLIGVVSASDVDFERRSAQVSYVFPKNLTSLNNVAIESLSCLVGHLIDTVGIERIWSGHVMPDLIRWASKTMCVGFRPEGVMQQAFRKGRSCNDVLRMALLATDFSTKYRCEVDAFLNGSLTESQFLVESPVYEKKLQNFLDVLRQIQS